MFPGTARSGKQFELDSVELRAAVKIISRCGPSTPASHTRVATSDDLGSPTRISAPSIAFGLICRMSYPREVFRGIVSSNYPRVSFPRIVGVGNSHDSVSIRSSKFCQPPTKWMEGALMIQ